MTNCDDKAYPEGWKFEQDPNNASCGQCNAKECPSDTSTYQYWDSYCKGIGYIGVTASGYYSGNSPCMKCLPGSEGCPDGFEVIPGVTSVGSCITYKRTSGAIFKDTASDGQKHYNSNGDLCVQCYVKTDTNTNTCPTGYYAGTTYCNSGERLRKKGKCGKCEPCYTQAQCSSYGSCSQYGVHNGTCSSHLYCWYPSGSSMWDDYESSCAGQ